MRKILFTLLVTIMLLPGTAMAFDHSYKLWNSDLKQFNESGYIHYGAWQRNQARLTQFLGAIQAVTHREINGWTPAQDAILAKQQWPWRVDYHAARRSLNGGD